MASLTASLLPRMTLSMVCCNSCRRSIVLVIKTHPSRACSIFAAKLNLTYEMPLGEEAATHAAGSCDYAEVGCRAICQITLLDPLAPPM